MSGVNQAKIERTTAKGQLTITIKELNATIKDNRDKKVVEDRYERLKQQWSVLVEKHAVYLAHAYPDEEPDASEDQWLENCFTSYTNVEKTYELFQTSNREEGQDNKISAPTTTSRTKKMKNAVKFEMSALQTSINCVNSSIKDKEASECTIKEMQDQMKSQIDRCYSKQRELVDILSDDEDIEEQTKLMSQMQALYLETNLSAGKEIKNRSAKQETPSKVGIEMKLERMKLPTFAGEIRDYNCFKTDFINQVMPQIKHKAAASYTLRSCLSKDPLEIVKSIDDDINEMWRRLDERYGRTSVLTSVIMEDIQSIKAVSEGNGKQFMDLVNLVEKCYRSLAKVNCESEMSNSTIVGFIEKKLPPSIHTMWCLEVSDAESKVEDRNKFPYLLKFLLKHRRAIEYGSSDIRSKKCSHVQIETSIQHHMKDEIIIKKAPIELQEKVDIYCWIHESNLHDIVNCRVFTDKSPRDRWDLTMDHRACWLCLKTGHRKADCIKSKQCSTNGCKSFHHPLLHEIRTTYPNQSNQENKAVLKTDNQESFMQKHFTGEERAPGKKFCLLQLMSVNAGIKNVAALNVMWDSGATVSMITFKKAKELELTGVKTKITIVKIGGQKETVDSKLYEVPVHDTQGNVEVVKAYGINQISTAIEATETGNMAGMFDVDSDQVQRPQGEIDMLVGFEYAGFHPEKEKAIDHLLLMKNKFGRCISGSHISMHEKTQLLLQEAQVAHAVVKFEDFYNAESMGISCQPKCGGCKCGECSVGGKPYTLKQERELMMIEQGLQLSDDKWVAKYPWIKAPQELPNNYNVAYAMLRSTERRLLKDKESAELYHQQIVDMEERGVARKLTESESLNYQGPIYYISHHEVLKPESISTPFRIVFNSSARYFNQTLNDYWAKGPDMMNNLLGVLLRFREDKVAIAGDISKMYHTVAISELDQHTHRFLWREMDLSKDPDTYMMTAVSFGDKPAGAIASLALKKTAEMSKEHYSEAAMTIERNAYVDDIIGSFENEAVAQRIAAEIETVLAKGSFRIKEWIISHQKERLHETTEGHTRLHETTRDLCSHSTTVGNGETSNSKVLGIVWDPHFDLLQFVVKINFSPKKRKIHTGPNLTNEDIPSKVPDILTRRSILSIVNGIYDPEGLAAPFVVKAKILLRRLTIGKFEWDEPIPNDERDRWVNLFTEMFEMEQIKFHRSTKPHDAFGEPTLVVFCDASENAFGACAYIRWEKSDTFESRLLMAKSRIAPMKRITIPRLELNAALIAARMKDFIEKETSMKFSRIYMIGDSEIVRAQIQRESYGFNTFVGVRIGEIQSITSKDDWYWTESSLNIADIITRGETPSALGIESEWQTGPAFLQQTEENWPLKQSFSGKDIPDQIVMSLQTTEADDVATIGQIIDIERHSDYASLLRVTARTQSAIKGKSLKCISQIPDRDSIIEAEKLWIRQEQSDIDRLVKPETMKRLGVTDVDGIKVAGCRLENWQRYTYDNHNPVILSAKSRFAQLYAQKVHDQCHLGVSAVMVKIRCKYWIIGLRQLVKSIRSKCITCKRLDKVLQQQRMGKIPQERLRQPAHAWSYTSLDLFGPFEIRGETNKRSRGKAYGVIFNCLQTRAIHLELVTDYSTEAFLLSVRRFIALRGSPMKIWSDRGSQLVAANKELKQAIAQQNEQLIQEFGSNNSIDWKFNSADAPWQNGCAEALIKSAKRAITVSIGAQVLSFSETQTVMYECANLLNDRPIGRHPSSIEDGNYLCPNDMILLGKSANRCAGSDFTTTTNTYVRYRFVQKIITAFWNKWTRDFFPSLTVWPKWHTAQRNVKVGDIVLIQDSNQIRGKWKLGRVTQAVSSLRDGFVRNVEIEYKNEGSQSFTTISRPVQRIIVLVPVDEKEQ